MLTNPSPKTITTSADSNCSVSSISSLTLDSDLDSNASLESEITASPREFDGNDIESNFITISPKSQANVRRILSTPSITFSEDVTNTNVITLSKKSKHLSLHSIFQEDNIPNKLDIKLNDMENFLRLMPIEYYNTQPAKVIVPIQSSDKTPKKLSNVHKLFYGISLLSITTGTILLIVQNIKKAQHHELTFPGVLLIAMGALMSLITAGHYHLNKNNDQKTSSELSIEAYHKI